MANPLTFIMPLAEGGDPLALGSALGELQPKIDAALEAVGTVHYARFVLLDRSQPDLQPSPSSIGPFSLAVITSFDGDFDVYIQDFVNKLGPIFDALLQFSSDGTELVPVAEHVEELTAYVAAHDASRQPPNSAFPMFNAYPYTVQQVLANAPT
jgi:hypothetical protein